MNNDNALTDTQSPMFLYISVTRLILLSIASCGLYEAYWIYKNWRFLKERDGLNIRPFWRGVFGVFFCHSLLRTIYSDESTCAIEQPSFSPDGLATGWVILVIVANLISRAPGAVLSIVSFVIPSYLCLVPVQLYINSVNLKHTPRESPLLSVVVRTHRMPCLWRDCLVVDTYLTWC